MVSKTVIFQVEFASGGAWKSHAADSDIATHDVVLQRQCNSLPVIGSGCKKCDVERTVGY